MAKQGGVHIGILVVAVVICIGLIVLAVEQGGTIDKARTAQKQAEDATAQQLSINKKVTAERNELRKLVHGDDETAVDIDEAKELLAKVSKAYEDSPATSSTRFDNFKELASKEVVAADTWKAIADKSKAERAVAENAKRVSEDESASTLNKLQEASDATKQEVNAKQQQLEEQESQATKKQNDLNEQIEQQSDTHLEEIAIREEQIWILKNRLQDAQAQVNQLKEEINQAKTYGDSKPDGSIIEEANELGFAWIDLGRKQHLREGTVFSVFQFVKGGQRLQKGQVEVIKVDVDLAKVRITKTIDNLNPIGKGDQITSPFYSRDKSPTFVFAGKNVASKRISLDELTRRIKLYGGAVDSDVKTETTYLVALDGFKSTPEYKAARELGVTLLSEKDLLEFLGF